MFRKYPELFKDPKIQYPIDDFNLDFADYIIKNRSIIAKYRPVLNPNENIETIVSANAPFEFYPEKPIFSEKNPGKLKSGALLVHGLLDTPFIMKDIGTALQTQGLLVRSILLPGHGTVPGALLNVKYEEWLQAVRYGIESLKKEVDQIYLVGFSTGAILNLYLTYTNPAQIAGLIMLCPAYKINSPFDFISNWPRLIDSIWPRAAWLSVCKEIDYTKYMSVTFNSVYQVYRLTQEIKKINGSKQPPCPIFMALSYEDLIVNSLVSIKNFSHYIQPNNKMVLYSKNPKSYDDPRIVVRSAEYPQWNIESFSHIAIPPSPQNPHYGKDGDYPLASRIEENSLYHYRSMDKPLAFFLASLYKLKLVKHQYQRLTFNPDFDFMMSEMESFIKSIT